MAGTMHLAPAERIVYEMTAGDSWEGSCDAPTGAFTQVSVLPGKILLETMRDLSNDGEIDNTPDQSDVAGYWIIQEDSNGVLHFKRFEHEASATLTYAMLTSQYYYWLGEDDGESELV